MLWFLHLASDAGVEVHGYCDRPMAQAEVAPSGAGRFLSVELRPEITVAAGTVLAAADEIHGRIHEVCFIARSVNFPVTYAATYSTM